MSARRPVLEMREVERHYGEGTRRLTILDGVALEVARGDNTGKQLSYTNVGRGRVPIGDWTGGAKQFEIAKADTIGADSDGWIITLQSYENGKPGVVLAARKSSNI